MRPIGGGIADFSPVTCSMGLFLESEAKKIPAEEEVVDRPGSWAHSKCGPGNGFSACGDRDWGQGGAQGVRDDYTCTGLCAKSLLLVVFI